MAWLKTQADAAKAQEILNKFPDRRQLSDTDRQALAMLQREIGAWTNPAGKTSNFVEQKDGVNEVTQRVNPKSGMYAVPRHPGDVISKMEANPNRDTTKTGPITDTDATLGGLAVSAIKGPLKMVGVPTNKEEALRPFKSPGNINIPGTDRYVPIPPPASMGPLGGAAQAAYDVVKSHQDTMEKANKSTGVERVLRTGAALTPLFGPMAAGMTEDIAKPVGRSMRGEQIPKEEALAATESGSGAIAALALAHPQVEAAIGKGFKTVEEAAYNRKLKSVGKKLSAEGPAKHLQGTLAEFLPNNGMDTRAARGEEIGNALVDEYGGKLPNEAINQKRLDEYVAHKEKHIIESGAKVPEHKAIDAMMSDAAAKSREEVWGKVATENSPVGREVLGILLDAEKHGWTPEAYGRLRELGAGPPPEIKEAVKSSKSGASSAARKAEASANNAKSAQQKLMDIEAEAQIPPDAAVSPEKAQKIAEARAAKLEKARASAAKAQQVAQDAANFAEESSLAYQDAAAAMEEHKSFPLPKQLQDAIKFVEVTREINGGTLQDLPASAIDAAKKRANKKVEEATFNKEPSEADKSQAEFYRNIGTKLRRAVIDHVNAAEVAAPADAVKYKKPGETDTEFLHRRVAELRGVQQILKNKRVQSLSPVPLNQTVIAPSGTGIKKYMNVAGGLDAAAGAGAAFVLSGGNPIATVLGAPFGAVAARYGKDFWRSPETHQRIASARREGLIGEPNSVWYRRQVEAGKVPTAAKPPRGTPPVVPTATPSGKGSAQYNKTSGENIPNNVKSMHDFKVDKFMDDHEIQGTLAKIKTASTSDIQQNLIPMLEEARQQAIDGNLPKSSTVYERMLKAAHEELNHRQTSPEPVAQFPQRRTQAAKAAAPPPSSETGGLTQQAMDLGRAKDNGKGIRAFWKEKGENLKVGDEYKDENGVTRTLTERKLAWLKEKGTKEPAPPAAEGRPTKEPKKPKEPKKKPTEATPPPLTEAQKAGNTEPFSKGTSRTKYAADALDKLLTPEQKARMQSKIKGSQPTKKSAPQPDDIDAAIKAVEEDIAAAEAEGADTDKAKKFKEALNKSKPKSQPKTKEKQATITPVEPKAPPSNKAELTPELRAERLTRYKAELAQAKKNAMQGDKNRIKWLEGRIDDLEGMD